ncbi:hypothetical protein VSU19_20865 [Verrucomicrobiales bacterium BCK34]|nr:hypothetical protein [Verrucomicrobiales bacterium BCK34]
MKKLKFTCSNCQAKLRVPTHLAGVSAPCPKCGETITAPSDVTLAEEDEPTSASHESAIQKDPVPVGARSATQNVPAPAVAGVPVTVGAGVTNKATSPQQQKRVRVVSSAPPVAKPDEEEVEEVIKRPTYGQQIPVPIPPAPTPEELAAAALDEERAAAEAPPEVHAEEMPVSLDDIAIPDHVVQAPVAPEPEVAPAPVPAPSGAGTLEKTQPIQVNAQPRNLPESRVDSGAESGDLPRLDVTLGEQHTSAAASEMLSPDGITQREPTKVQLPAPGAESRQYTPDDFIIPGKLEEPAEPAEQAYQQEEVQPEAEPDLQAEPEPDFEVPEATGDPVYADDSDLIDFSSGQFDAASNLSFDETPQPEETPGERVETREPASVSELLGLDGFDPEPRPSAAPVARSAAPSQAPEPTVSVPEELQAESHSPEIALPDGLPAAGTPAPEAIQQPVVGATEPAVTGETVPQGGPKQFSAPVEDDSTEPLSRNPIAASAGSHRTEPAPASAPAPAPAVVEPQKRSEADVLDDMFGGSESGGNFGLNIKLLIIAGAAVLATVAVFLFGNAMGGWSISDPATTDSAIKPITPERTVEPEQPEVVLTPEPPGEEPSIQDAPAIVDPVAENPVAEASRVGSTIAMPGDTSTPVTLMDSSGNVRPPEGGSSASAPDSTAGVTGDAPARVDTAALSFDERVQSIVNGNAGSDDAGMSVIGGASSAAPATSPDSGSGAAPADKPPAAAGSANSYNPEPFYPAPVGDEGSPLGKTHELIDAFLRAPDWETRLRYTYQGDSLKPAVESYYQKWAERPVDRFSLQLFQMESDPEMGGPYWVYLISTSDQDQGFPLIVRVEDGNLKVDWEIYSEFYDKHFVRFRSGEIPGPATFRLVIERMSDYYGADRDGFKDLDDYYVYQINPPYGDLNEFSEYAFVKKDSEVAKSLDAVVGLGEEPLAVIITLDKSSFAHGIKHFVITDYVTEGWFR